jgi:hypothetical protein
MPGGECHRALKRFLQSIQTDRRIPLWGQGFGPAAELPLGAELYVNW